MSRRRCATFALLISLVTLAGSVTRTNAAIPQADFPLPTDSSPQTLSASVSTDWWTGVQENIRQSEYHVTWQDHTYLPGVPAAYQAPNRAHNLRTYFTPDGPVTIPRIQPEESATPSWHWGLRLTAWGWAESLQPVDVATLYADANRLEYRRGALTEWYVNDERGLEQGFTITRPPQQAGEDLVLELALVGDLTPNLTDDGTAAEFTTHGGSPILRYSGLRASDATGRQLPAHLEFLESPEFPNPPEFPTPSEFPDSLEFPELPEPPLSPGNKSVLKIFIDSTATVYPITISSLLTSAAIASMGLSTNPDWTADGGQDYAGFGHSVGTAGDVNGDGYSDVIVGAPSYDNGQAYEGRAFVYYGSAAGLSTTANWTAESNQANADFGVSVGTAGDVNGDGYADIIVGAEYYDNGQTDEGRAYVYYSNGGNGLALRPRQMRSDGSVHVSPLGISDSPTAVQLRLNGRMPLGREKVKLQWQVAPLGIPFTATTVISGTSATWTDALPTMVITQNVTGLTPFTPYHWRVRLLYHPGNRLGQTASRWIHIPWNGWTEQDFRTPEQAIAGLVATNDSPTLLGSPTTLTATITAGSNVSYTWAFGDDTTGSGAVVTHTYPAVGVYTAVVTASNSVSVLTATTTVTVSPSGPVKCYVYLPLVLRHYAPPVTFLLPVGDPIPARDVAYQGEIFYRRTVQIPAALPSGGKFYFSSRRDAVVEVLVDDELAVLVDGADVFTYLFPSSGFLVPAIVEVPRTTMEQLAGRTAVIEYRDMYSVLVEASEMWLIWTP